MDDQRCFATPDGSKCRPSGLYIYAHLATVQSAGFSRLLSSARPERVTKF